jgi:hypothetical protein
MALFIRTTSGFAFVSVLIAWLFVREEIEKFKNDDFAACCWEVLFFRLIHILDSVLRLQKHNSNVLAYII